MATTTKKGAKKAKPRPRSPLVKKSRAKQADSIQSLRHELAEAVEQQAATSEILRMIARSPANLQSVMDSIAENAARLCEADDAVVRRIDEGVLQQVSHFGLIPTRSVQGERQDIVRSSLSGRAVIERKTIHVKDLRAAETEFPGAKTRGIVMGVRTALVTPLLRDGVPLGVIHIRRREVQPFSNRQIKLLETFADQAVLAIENARLFQELSEKSTKLESSNSELREALEQQTATSEILRVISSSPTNLQPVFETILADAVRLCESHNGAIFTFDGEVFHVGAGFNITGELQAYPPGSSNTSRPGKRGRASGTGAANIAHTGCSRRSRS
jgi:two-component system, NtrC family, sensor kinase